MKGKEEDGVCRCRHHGRIRHLLILGFHLLTFTAAVATLAEVETLRRHHMRERHGRK